LERLNQILLEETKPDFWNDQQKAKRLLQEKAHLEKEIQRWEQIKKEEVEIQTLLEFSLEDKEFLQEAQERLKRLHLEVKRWEIERLFTEEDDKANAFLNINAGAGGTEAQDWAEMLLRMYLRYAEEKGWKSEIIDLSPGEEAGIKSATLLIRGEYVYGYLKGETGVHRLVRISPFDASRRRHTSFASVSVFPETPDDIKIEIKESDLKIETFRSSGPGGQHVNKTETAVRITHLPTGIVVQCQNERSQYQNKAMALKLLKAKLYELERQKRLEKWKEIHKNQKEIAWGNQIRSYILQPYKLVKDHRTNVERTDAERVLDGDLDDFIEAYLYAQFKTA
jgi:peptide chain release factor 2